MNEKERIGVSCFGLDVKKNYVRIETINEKLPFAFFERRLHNFGTKNLCTQKNRFISMFCSILCTAWAGVRLYSC